MKYTNTREVMMKEDAPVRPRNVNWAKILSCALLTIPVFSLISINILQHQGFISFLQHVSTHTAVR